MRGPRAEAMPLWVKVWYRMPLLDRRAREYMWNHGYWWVAPSPDWVDTGHPVPYTAAPLRSSPYAKVRLRLMRRTRWHFGIRWSPVFHIAVWLVALIVGALWNGWVTTVALGILGELTLGAVSLWAGRNLGRDVKSYRP